MLLIQTNFPLVLKIIEDYPVFAIKFKRLDEFAGGLSFWYCAGEVLGARNDSVITANWADRDDDVNDEENDWSILTFDLSYETTWEDRINGFRLDITANNELNGETFELAWCGFFTSEEDAYRYAEMGDTWDAYYGEDDESTEPDEQTTSKPETTKAPDETEKQPSTTKPSTTASQGNEGSYEIGEWIWIVIAGIAACAIIVVLILALKKKK